MMYLITIFSGFVNCTGMMVCYVALESGLKNQFDGKCAKNEIKKARNQDCRLCNKDSFFEYILPYK